MTTIPETEDASVHNIDTLKEQLIWSQKQELDRLRHAFDSQKEMIAIQQQQIQVLEANLFEALLRANSHIYLQHVAVETSDTTPEEQVQQPTRDDNHLDDMDDATAAKDIHEEEDEDNNDDDPDEQQHMAHV